MIGESDTRPWGTWQILDEGDGFKVKRIEVRPHSRLSYQTHAHRAEHWVIVAGKASSIIADETVVSGPGECVEIGIGVAHRIVNDEDEPLVLIEVQRGDYCGEDDIVRLEDDYGRTS